MAPARRATPVRPAPRATPARRVIDGIDGLHGTNGTNGVDGAPGAKGDKGDTGATGAAGSNGSDGAPGAEGDTGAKGEKGDKGDTGNTGAAGTNGSNGADGRARATRATPAHRAAPGGSEGRQGRHRAQGRHAARPEQTAATAPTERPAPRATRATPAHLARRATRASRRRLAAAYSPIVDVNPILRPSRSNLWDRAQINGNSWFNGYRSSFPNGTDESYLEWDIPLQAGTWTIDVVYVKSHDAGILSLSLGGDTLGPEIDAYVPEEDGIEYNQVATSSSVKVATTGIHTLRIKTAAKNAASAGYFGYLTWIRLVRE